jgi:hypothetical protein
MIYIQSDSDKSRPHHFDCASAMYGAIETGNEYRLTTYEEVEFGKFDGLIRRNLFVGSVEFMRLVYSRIGMENVRLPSNSNRSHYTSSLGEIKRQAKLGKKAFIKPYDIKLFTGFVIDQMQHASIQDVPDETQIMVYDVFKYPIESEWRCYIHYNKVKYIANYSGDLYVNINGSYLESVIKENSSRFPCAYTIDIGILTSGENVVIEFNDMWAIGNYGISNDDYLRMLKDRYFQIVR